MEKKTNGLGQALTVVGAIVMILGFIGSIVLGNSYAYGYDDFNVAVFFIGLISTAITGFSLLGFGELIKIAHDSREYLKMLTNTNMAAPNAPASSNTKSASIELPEI